jgi:hypothetical protein
MTPRIFASASLVLLGSLAVTDCATEVCACELVISPAFVRGRVLLEDDTPVPAAQVHTFSAPAPGCASLDVDFGVVETIADGSYNMGLPSAVTQDNVCVFVFSQPPRSTPGLADSDTTLVILDFHQDGVEDSARVDLVLRNR